jgi:competence protein ComEA
MSGPGEQIRRRIDDLLFERPPTPTRLTAAVLLLLAGIGLAALIWWPSGGSDPSRLPFVTVPPATTTDPVEVVVHVAGAVARPGLYVRPADDRIADLLAAAGGVVEGGRPDLLNLAAPLRDGTRIWVPSDAELTDPGPIHDGSAAPRMVDVNRATAIELESLPGVGPSLAAAIVRHRERMGSFDSLDGLLEVPGIGPAKLAGLLDRVVL